MKINGLISKLIMPFVFTGLVGLTGCAERGINQMASPEKKMSVRSKEDEDLRKSALVLYWGCTLAVGEEKIDDYEALVFGMAYKNANNPLENQKMIEDAILFNFRNRGVKNKKAYEMCQWAAETIKKEEWKDSNYVNNWGCLKETYQILVTDKMDKFYSVNKNGKDIYLIPIGELPIIVKGVNKKAVFCKAYDASIVPEIQKKNLEMKTSPGKD